MATSEKVGELQDDSVSQLLSRYGYTFPSAENDDLYNGSNSQNGFNISAVPFYFTRAGMQYDVRLMSDPGSHAWLWTSRTGNGGDFAYNYVLDPANIYPMFYLSRMNGLSL